MAMSHSRTRTTRRSARFRIWAATAHTTPVSRRTWQAWASHTLTRQAPWTTPTALGGIAAQRPRHRSTAAQPPLEQASRALAEGVLGALARDGQRGEYWPTQPISPTPRQTANVRWHLGKSHVFY